MDFLCFSESVVIYGKGCVKIFYLEFCICVNKTHVCINMAVAELSLYEYKIW